MYKGKQLEQSEVALLFIHERPNMTCTSVDDKNVNFFPDGKVLEFRPSIHTFEVNLSTYRAYGTGTFITYTLNFLVKSFKLELNMKPNYTYALNFYGINVETLPEELCFYGELHQAEGSSVNITGEYRTMSENAELFACTKVRTITN